MAHENKESVFYLIKHKVERGEKREKYIG